MLLEIDVAGSVVPAGRNRDYCWPAMWSGRAAPRQLDDRGPWPMLGDELLYPSFVRVIVIVNIDRVVNPQIGDIAAG
jgi:hypothetical protein